MKALLRRRSRTPQTAKRFTAAGLILAATGFAAGELALGLGAGFFHGGRAEPLLFLAFRPWLLLALSAAIGAFPFRQRLALVLLGLTLATVSETMLMLSLGAASPWVLALRGWLAGLLLALALDFVFTNGREFFGKGSVIGMGLPLLALFLYPGGLKGYDAITLGTERPVARGPDLMLMTGLPIIWGEKGAFDPQSRPAASYQKLQQQYRVRPLDVLDPQALGTGRLLLLAQPRALAPEELVAVDGWVRGGGRVLVLTDPALQWPTQLPLGDLRRPSPVGLLGPLLDHWGVDVEAPATRETISADLASTAGSRRLILAAPGHTPVASTDCREEKPWLARCRIGAGEALILADADLLRDDLWVGAGANGQGRHHRLSDNVVAVADLLDGLAGIDRSRQRGRVDWLPVETNGLAAILAALLPLVLSTVAAAVLRRRH